MAFTATNSLITEKQIAAANEVERQLTAQNLHIHPNDHRAWAIVQPTVNSKRLYVYHPGHERSCIANHCVRYRVGALKTVKEIRPRGSDRWTPTKRYGTSQLAAKTRTVPATDTEASS